MSLHVYIAGPLNGSGTQDRNIRRACVVADELTALGMVPFVPHLNVLWALCCPSADEEKWMAWDLAWLARCDALYRLAGRSPGADREVARATELGIPVFLECDRERGREALVNYCEAHAQHDVVRRRAVEREFADAKESACPHEDTERVGAREVVCHQCKRLASLDDYERDGGFTWRRI